MMKIWEHITHCLYLQKQGKYQGAYQYGIFVQDIEVGRMCREKVGKRDYEWNVHFWDMPDHGHQDRFEVPECFPHAKAAREWLKSNHGQINTLKKHSEPTYVPIKQRIPEHIR
jgi:hypothetical protein